MMAESDNDSGVHSNRNARIREQDGFLPIANLNRAMKKTLPANAKISKDAKETIQECGEASDKFQRGEEEDDQWRCLALGHDHLRVYLAKYREMEGEKSSIAGSKEVGNSAGSAVSSGGSYSGETVIGGGNYSGAVLGYRHGGQLYGTSGGGGGSGGFHHILGDLT